MVHSPTLTVGDPAFRKVVANVEHTLRADDAIDRVLPPARGASISRDGHTAIVRRAPRAAPNGMVLAAGELKRELARLGDAGGRGQRDRRRGDVVRLQRVQP